MNSTQRPDTIASLLAWRAELSPDAMAYRYVGSTDGAQEHTYRELHTRALQIAAALNELGGRGERVLLLFPPGLEFIEAFMGCVTAGAVAVAAPPPNPLKPERSIQRMGSIVRSAKPQIVLTLTSFSSLLQPVVGHLPEFEGLKWVCVDEIGQQPIRGWKPPAIAPSDLAMLQYTSGSTSDPKGAMLTHECLLANLEYFDQGWQHRDDTVAVNWLPAFHDLGLVYGILAPVWGGYPSIQMSPIDVIQKPIRWLQTLSDVRATHSCGPNFIYDLCVRKVTAVQAGDLDLSHWRMALTAAEPVRAETMTGFARHFSRAGFRPGAFCPGYGLSEATCKVAAVSCDEPAVALTIRADSLERDLVELSRPGKDTRTIVGCGRPGALADVRVVDHSTGQEVAGGAVGEIWVHGPGIATGYWEHPEATSRELQARLPGRGDRDYLRTGDLGFIYQGQLFLTGRIKDLIIIRGANHYPQDLEYTVQQSHGNVRAGCVAAFSFEEGGEEHVGIVAEVERRTSSQPTADDRRMIPPIPDLPLADSALDPAEAVAAITRAVAQEHGLRVARVVLVKAGSIPKTTSGKIKRRETRRQMLASELRPFVDTRPDTEVLQQRRDELLSRVTAIVCDAGSLSVDVLNPDESLHIYGVDSLSGVNIAYELAEMTGHDVPSHLVAEQDTVNKLVTYIIGLGAAA